MTAQQIIKAWNAQADEYNQWENLGEDEKLEWAFKQSTAAKNPLFSEMIARHPGLSDELEELQRQPLINEQIDELYINGKKQWIGKQAIEQAHGITGESK